MDLDLNLREEAPSHGPSSGAPQPLSTPTSTTTTTASSSTSTPTRDALDQELASRSVADDQRARYGAFSAAAPGEGPSDAAQRAAAAFQASTYGTAPGDQPAVDTTPQKPGELSAGPSATAERMPVPLQPRPTSYAQFQAAGGTSGMGVPLRPAAGKARSNSWSYPASAVAPYAVHPYVASTAGASGIGTGMPAPGPAQPRANRTTTYRQRGGSLSFSSPEDAMRQQYLQQQQAQQQQQGSQMFLPYAGPQPTSQPQPMMAQDSSFLGYGGGGGVGDGGGFLSAYQQQSTQPVAAAQSTPPLPTTPSSFIRRTSLPQTYLHTIPISRSASSGFTPASTDTALPILAQPQTTEVHQKLEIPTHGARALPKEIATHPAIQSITKYIQWAPGAPTKENRSPPTPPTPHLPFRLHANASAHFSPFLPLHPRSQSDSQQATGEAAAEKEVGVEITGEEGEAGAGGVQPSEGKFVDISEYLNLPQSKVAKTLGIPSSTLSKRWKEAARARKWPWRTVCKIDKEIMALLHNIPPSVAAKGPEHVPPEIHTRLLALLKQRQDELKPVIIRL